jgi:hypothetical protein
MKNKRLEEWVSNLSLTLLAILISEIGLRTAGVSYPNFFRSDEHTGFSLRPGAVGWYRGEGEAYVRINSQGLRDREHNTTKPGNTLRIAVLGDSMAEARQVALEDTFWAVLERDLKTCPDLGGRDAEAINFGVSGYGTAQELITLRRRVWDYSPDIVVLAFLTDNDISDNFRPLGSDPRRPYFIYENGSLALDSSFRDEAAYRASRTALGKLFYWAVDYSRILQLFNEVKNRIRSNAIYRSQIGEKFQDPSTRPELSDLVYLEPSDPLWKEAWRVTEGLIVLARNEVTQRGADFLVVTLTNPIQVYPDASVRKRFMQRVGLVDLFYPDRRIKALGLREGFSVLNLAEDFQLYAEQHKVFLHGFEPNPGGGHWNKEGHRLAGKTIAERLCRDATARGRPDAFK